MNVTPRQSVDGKVSRIQAWLGRQQYKKQRVDLYRSLARVYTGAVRPGQLTDVMGVLVRTLESRDSSLAPPLSAAVGQIRDGVPMAEAFTGLAPPADVMTMSAYQSSDALGAMFATLARLSSAQKQMRARLRVLAKPVGYLVVMLVVIAVFAFMLLPVLKDASPIERWPEYARWFGYMAEFVAQQWKFVVAGAVAAVVTYIWALPNWHGATRLAVDRTFLFSWYRELRAADFMSGLAAQLDAGTKFVPALRNLRDVAEPYLADYIERIEERALVEFPDNPLAALRVGLLSDEVVDAIEILRTGGSDPAPIIAELGSDAYESAAFRIEVLAGRLSLVLLCLTGALLVWAFGAMTAPLSEGLGKANAGPSAATQSTPRR
jgi:hypothetical protein